jgi:hypothetical protein
MLVNMSPCVLKKSPEGELVTCTVEYSYQRLCIFVRMLSYFCVQGWLVKGKALWAFIERVLSVQRIKVPVHASFTEYIQEQKCI